jgi:hypothetical protein
VDYPAGLFSVYVAAFVLLRISGPERFKAALALGAGGIVPVLACGWYHLAAFGNVFTNSYRFRVHAADRGVFSLADPLQSLPNGAKLFAGFLHPYSGIFLYHPLMLVGLVASVLFVIRERDREMRLIWALAAATIGTNLLIYCSYPLALGPSSGPSFLIRYTVYSTPFAALALAALVDRTRDGNATTRTLLWALAIANAAPVWVFALYGCPVSPSRDYSALLAEIGPANYTLTKLHQAHILASPIWGWIGFFTMLAILYCWRHLVGAFVGGEAQRIGRPLGGQVSRP